MTKEREIKEGRYLGREVPAVLICDDGSALYKLGRFSIGLLALNPSRNYGQRGLFLDGPRHDAPNIVAILALVQGKEGGRIKRIVDVTKHVKWSFGPGM